MISLSEFNIKRVDEKDGVANFEIGPLPTGYGNTLANSLKRILSSSIPGSAITAVKINGVPHEYSTLSGVKDDILMVVLALKKVIVLSKTDEPVRLKLSVKGSKGAVTHVKAGDFEKNADIEVMNPDYVITELTDASTFDAEIVVERSIGYKLPNEKVRQEVGMLPVDAFFSPVTLVRYTVVPTRVGKETELDQVNMEIRTNTSITPSDALSIASNILNEMANNFVNQTKDMISGRVPTTLPTQAIVTRKDEKAETAGSNLKVADMNLSTRLTNALLRSGFDDLSKLEGFTEEEVANIRGMGEKSLLELLKILKDSGIKLI